MENHTLRMLTIFHVLDLLFFLIAFVGFYALAIFICASAVLGSESPAPA